MTATAKGVLVWGGERDDEGYRTFNVTTHVETDDTDDGPQTVMFCSSLPQIGDEWNFGNDTDIWCFCYPYMKVSLHEHREGEIHSQWRVDQKFSNRPLKRCQDTNIEDPLLEPAKISGSFLKDRRPRFQNYDGSYMLTSSWERLTGPDAQFDYSNPTVIIQKNYATLDLPVFSQMIDYLNDDVLWGLPARCVKLSDAPWERNLYGTCGFYFTKTFHFDINYNTWDRYLLDEGTKVLRGHWAGSDTPGTADDTNAWIIDAGVTSANPLHFIRAKDRNGENIRIILDGHGQPWDASGTLGPGTVFAAPYFQTDFTVLGIPTNLETGI